MEMIKGSSNLQTVGQNLQIGVSDGAIIHWKDFSIASEEHVEFLQPSAKAWVLNKVTGKGRSEIYGELTSNGQVVLINQNGILFGKDSRIEVGGLIATSLKDVSVEGSISASNGALALLGRDVHISGEVLSRVGKHAYVRAEENPYGIEVSKVGGRIYVHSEESTTVTQSGLIKGENVYLLSDGVTHFQGKAHVGDIEISGKNGFYHEGEVKRTGKLLLDPESDVTISTVPSYNYNLKDGPSSDFSNITIDKLIEELGRGPVTITTLYQGEGGATGSIVVKDDIDHTFNSHYPLVFCTKSADGILIEGGLTNVGSGAIELIAPKATITGKLIGQNLKIEGNLSCLGELYGKNLTLLSKGASEISGKLMTDGGTLSWKTTGDILLSGEWGHLGGGALLLDGVQNFWIEEGALFYATNRTTELTIKNLSGSFSIERGLVSPGCAPLLISGPLGSVSLEGGRIDSMAPITIDVGHHCHLHQSHITSHKPIRIDLGSELLLMKGSTLGSPLGPHVNAKGDITILDTSSITGRGLFISAGETLTLLDHGSIRGGSGPVSIGVGKDVCLDGPNVQVEGGQITLLPGKTLTLEDGARISSTLGSLSISAGSSIRLDDQAWISVYG
jgi:filamentous hemagglutinin family protein